MNLDVAASEIDPTHHHEVVISLPADMLDRTSDHLQADEMTTIPRRSPYNLILLVLSLVGREKT